jgi:hypothetical protein
LAIQALLCKACLTFQCFLEDILKINEAMSIGFVPLSHGASQNVVFPLLPTVMVVAGWRHRIGPYPNHCKGCPSQHKVISTKFNYMVKVINIYNIKCIPYEKIFHHDSTNINKFHVYNFFDI